MSHIWQNKLECSLCLEEFNNTLDDTPVESPPALAVVNPLLVCGHTSCSSCLQDLLNRQREQKSISPWELIPRQADLEHGQEMGLKFGYIIKKIIFFCVRLNPEERLQRHECHLPSQSIPVAALVNLVRVVWQHIKNTGCLAVLPR